MSIEGLGMQEAFLCPFMTHVNACNSSYNITEGYLVHKATGQLGLDTK
jgi:hypothetical protein